MSRATAKDEADIAAEQEEFQRQEAVWNARRVTRMQHRGRCYNCDEPCSSHFCDVDCRKDYERQAQTRRRQNGE